MSQRSQVSRLLLGGVLKMHLSLSLTLNLSLYLSLSIFLAMSCLLITLNKCLKGHKSLGWLLGRVNVFVFVFVNFFGDVMFSHHSEQMSQRSQVSRMALRRGSQNVFVFVFVFVFVNFFGHVMFSNHSEQMSQR